MKVKFKSINGSTLGSQGIKFKNGEVYEVSEKVGKYLISTFGDRFTAVVAAKKVESTPKKVIKSKED